MTADKARNRIIEKWRAEFAAAAGDHQRAVNAGDKGAAASCRGKMRALEKAIKAYKEEKLGELSHQASIRNQRAAADRAAG